MSTVLDTAGPLTRQVLNLLIGTDMLRRQVQVYKYVGSEWNATTRKAEKTFEDPITIKAARLQHTHTSAQATGNTDVQAGDWIYLFRASDVQNGLDQQDEVSDGGNRMAIIGDINWIAGYGFMISTRGQTVT